MKQLTWRGIFKKCNGALQLAYEVPNWPISHGRWCSQILATGSQRMVLNNSSIRLLNQLCRCSPTPQNESNPPVWWMIPVCLPLGWHEMINTWEGGLQQFSWYLNATQHTDTLDQEAVDQSELSVKNCQALRLLGCIVASVIKQWPNSRFKMKYHLSSMGFCLWNKVKTRRNVILYLQMNSCFICLNNLRA